MTDVLTRARAVMQAATPGKWTVEESSSVGGLVVTDTPNLRTKSDFVAKAVAADARAIVLAVNALSATLDALEVLRHQRDLEIADGGPCEDRHCATDPCALCRMNRALAAAEAALSEGVGT